MAQLKVTLLRSLNGVKKEQLATVEALGLHKIGQQVLHQDNEAIRGMLNRVSHLIVFEEVEGDA
ncbi:MAG: 50S ribosomal protein L30 [Eubacteriales bacterium]|nr:50S ribosomal protein L30 [Eubacteriales bacterium]MDD4323275.1 50S ribosomal protein L30 [Eubacteriales bacterium]MDD4540992.1 50S ribosomal protein L30 [Eubacteriales bacterium]